MKLKFGVKANMRLGNDAMVVSNMTKLLKDKKLKKTSSAGANLYRKLLNLEEKIVQLRLKLKLPNETMKELVIDLY
jgi:hypothetical protein